MFLKKRYFATTKINLMVIKQWFFAKKNKKQIQII